MYLQKWMMFLWALSLTDTGTALVPPEDAEIIFNEDGKLNFETQLKPINS